MKEEYDFARTLVRVAQYKIAEDVYLLPYLEGQRQPGHSFLLSRLIVACPPCGSPVFDDRHVLYDLG